nr:MAG TPA: hypothetical protein [Caudoviricetes sp.]
MLLFDQYTCIIDVHVVCAIPFVYCVSIPLIELTTKRARAIRARARVWVGASP